jgi:LssY C-terminus
MRFDGIKTRIFCGAVLLATRLFADTIPAGTELNIRLTENVASETAKAHTPVHAVLVAPVVIDGKVVLPLGVQLTGEVAQAKAGNGKERAELQLVFNQITGGVYRTAISAIVGSLDNARESVDEKGVITGIDASETFSSRIDQGIAKLGANEKLSGLAGVIEAAKEQLKIQDANPNIDYDSGAELTLRLTAPLDWRGTAEGPESKRQPFPNETALVDLVVHQPFRTVAEKPPRPSDITNIMFVGTEAELRQAFEKAGWSPAARLSAESKLETARALIEARGYKEGPMSVLLLDGKPPDMAWQKGNNTFAQRHHLRVFRRPGTFAGKPIWVCSSTHDTGIDFSERDRTFIHRIDPEIDKERAKVVSDFLFTGMVRSLAIVERPEIPRDLTNATGDLLRTDGNMAVLLLQ